MSIYLDNAATTAQKPEEVATKIAHILTSGQYGNPSRSTHEYALNGFREIEAVRQKVKDLFNADENYEVCFTNGATMSLNTVLHGLLNPGDHVITTCWEHNSVLRPLWQLEKNGVSVSYLEGEAVTGKLKYEALPQMLQPNTKMLVCTHASNVTGNVVALDKIKEFCAQHNLLLVIDASQTAGQWPIDLSDGVIDAVCFTGHKSLYGPSGTGGICLKKALPIKPLMTGGDGMKTFDREPNKLLPGLLESGTLNLVGIVGLGAALDYIHAQTIPVLQAKNERLQNLFYQELKKYPEIKIYGDFSQPKTGVISLNINDVESGLVSDLLWNEYRIATRPGYHCAPMMHETLGTKQQGAVRFSFSSFNTEEEVLQAVAALAKIIKS